MMEIGLFGGSFNPIHNGHIQLAESIKDLLGLDEVWFVVSPQNPLKPANSLLDNKARLEMVDMALSSHPALVSSDIEMTMPVPSYTSDTLKLLSQCHPNHRFTLLIGGDNWDCFYLWRNHEWILQHYRIAVYPRRSEQPETSSMGKGQAVASPHCKVQAVAPSAVDVVFVDTPLLDISSTMVRNMVHNHQDISGMVPPCVKEYIYHHGYYI